MTAIFLAGFEARPQEPDADPNAKVVAFAQSRIGEQVGDGECTSLARAALRAAGARSYIRAKEGIPARWGTPIKSIREAKPGDILQFENVVFRGRKRIIGPDGRPRIILTKRSFPHHVAIVAEVGEKGKTVRIWHQNVAGADGAADRTVSEETLVMAEKRPGGIMEIFRPEAP